MAFYWATNPVTGWLAVAGGQENPFNPISKSQNFFQGFVKLCNYLTPRVIDNVKSCHCRKIPKSLRVCRLKVTSFPFLKSEVHMQHLNLAKRLNFMIAIHLYFLASMFVSITFWMVCQAPDCLWSKPGSSIVFSCTSWWENLTDPTLVTPHLQHCNITIESLEHIFSNYYQDWMSCNQMMVMWS